MQIVFSLYGRPNELAFCLKSLLEANSIEKFKIHFDINESDNPKNDDVNRQVEKFTAESGLECTVYKHQDGYGADINVHRTLSKFSKKVLYFAGDVLIHKKCLEKYLELNARFPEYPITLYHPLTHPIRYKNDFAILRSTTVESLMLNPSLYFDYCLFKNSFVLAKVSTIDWLLSWVFKIRKVPVISDHFSYIQHLGLSGGMTSSKWPPTYCYDYVDQPAFFEILKKLNYDLNLCTMVRNRDLFPDFLKQYK